MAMASSFSPICLPSSSSSSSSSSLIRPSRHSSASLPPVSSSLPHGSEYISAHSMTYQHKRRFATTIRAASVVSAPTTEEIKEYNLPTWAEFELGMAPVFWKTMNGLPPTSGQNLTLFYNPVASKLVLNDQYGVAFNGGFNQPIMCGGEPRVMTKRNRGKADPPIFTIKIRVPRHAINLIFSFTNGVEWDGPYRLQFETLKMWRNKPISFFNEGLAQELSTEGACDRAIYPDPSNYVASCVLGNIYNEGGNSCKLNLVPGCMDPSSPLFDPLANVDDGSCPLDPEEE